MAQSTRFGRRLPLPSTRQIIHELRALSAHEAALKLKVPAAASDAVDVAPPVVPSGPAS